MSSDQINFRLPAELSRALLAALARLNAERAKDGLRPLNRGEFVRLVLAEALGCKID